MWSALRDRWVLPGRSADYVILRFASDGEKDCRVPDIFIPGLIDTWLSSIHAHTLYDIYESIGGSLPRGLTSLEHSSYGQQLRQHLVEAFQRGRLVALEIKHTWTAQAEVPPRPPHRESPQQLQPPQQPEVTYVAVKLVDEEGRPVPGVRYRVKLPGGAVREGSLNAHGDAWEHGVKTGQCYISFPELEDEDWSQVAPEAASTARRGKIAQGVTGVVNQFKLKVFRFRLLLIDKQDKPLRNQPYTLGIGAARYQGVTSEKGLIEQHVLPTEAAGALDLRLCMHGAADAIRQEHPRTQAGAYPPPISPEEFKDESPPLEQALTVQWQLVVVSPRVFDQDPDEAARGRLNNLGFHFSDSHGVPDAVRAYQRMYRLQETGALGDIKVDLVSRHDKEP